MSEGSRVTQKDVAQRAGVSQATVSLVLNGSRSAVSPETAARIDLAVEELGYRPNRMAQALRTQKSMVIACAVPDLTNPFYPALVAGVQQVAMGADYDVVAVNTGGHRALEEGVLAGAIQGRYDGIVGVFFSLGVPDFQALLKAGVGLARIESKRKSGGALPIDDVFVDNFAASKEATTELLGLGHRRIAMIAGEGGPQSVRVDGYRAALGVVGAPPAIWLEPSFTEAGGREATRRLLADGERPTAIVAANDLMAIGAMQALVGHGLHVPHDVSVIGFDNIMAADLVTPPLSSVALFQDQLGRRAAEMLLERLSGSISGPGRAQELPFRVIRRSSVSVPQGRSTLLSDADGTSSNKEETT